MLEFVHFRKSYAGIPAMEIDSLVLAPGIYWLQGVNGSGKSTLLKSLAGILNFDGDLVLNAGTSLKKHPVAYRRLVNFAEAEPLFPDFLSGMDLIKLFCTAKAAPAGQHEYFIESMEMNSWINQPLRTYSSGMLKKLSLVLAFMGRPDLILLDEPLITLDQASLSILYSWISRQYLQQGINFILSSHQLFEPDALPQGQTLVTENRSLRLSSR